MISFFKSQKVILGLRETIAGLNERIKDLKEQNISLIKRVEELQHRTNKLNLENSALHKMLDEQTALLREQIGGIFGNR